MRRSGAGLGTGLVVWLTVAGAGCGRAVADHGFDAGTGGAGGAGEGDSAQLDNKPAGSSCQSSSECASSFCVDGVCCGSACVGPCQSCALPDSLGTCVPVAVDSADPRASCVPEAVSTCGHTGRCDGAGACQLYPQDTICGVSSCVGDTWTASTSCDGQGTCRTPASASCAPYGCNLSAGRCNGGCPSGDAICPPGSYCAGDESCFPQKDLGAACGANHECKSGHCLDGACCGACGLQP